MKGYWHVMITVGDTGHSLTFGHFPITDLALLELEITFQSEIGQLASQCDSALSLPAGHTPTSISLIIRP